MLPTSSDYCMPQGLYLIISIFDIISLIYINMININNITMFRVIHLLVFEFVFGRIVHRTIRIRLNSLKPQFGTSLIESSSFIINLFTLFIHVDAADRIV